MNKAVRLLFVLSLLVLAGWGGNIQAQTPSAQPTDRSSYDLKPQAILDLQQLQQKYTTLAEAIPVNKYSWRPAAGVRSFSELFLHVVAAGFGYPPLLGAAAAPGFEAKDFEKSTTDKAKIIEWLNKSFGYAIANTDFSKALPKLGPDANAGDIVYLLVTHAHEHLGQSIAYARSVGVVPPWTVAAQKAAAAAPKE